MNNRRARMVQGAFLFFVAMSIGLSACSLPWVKQRPENDSCALRRQWWELAGLKRFAEARELLKANESRSGEWCLCPAAGQCMYNKIAPNPVPGLMARTDEEERKALAALPREERVLNFTPYNDTPIARAVADAQTRCQSNMKWTFNYSKEPVTIYTLSDGEVSEGRYETKDKCDEARLGTPEDHRSKYDHCEKKYYGKIEQVEVIQADFMYEGEFGRVEKGTVNFSSSDACQKATATPPGITIHGWGAVSTIGPNGSADKSRFIGKCQSKKITVCGPVEGADEGSANIEQIKFEM